MDESPRIGLIGCGKWGRLILRDLHVLGCHVWVVARSTESQANANGTAAIRVVSTVDQLPAELDGFVVATETSDHGAAVRRLLPRHRPIFVEKPLADDPVAARAIADEAPDRVFVMDKWRYHPGVIALAAMVADQRYGRLLALRLNRVNWGHAHRGTDAIWTLLPHDLGICLHLLGTVPEPVAVSGECDALGRPTGLMVFAKHGGVPVVCEVSSADPVRRRSVRAVFAEATVVLADAMADHLLLQRGRGGEDAGIPGERIPIPVEMPLFNELRAFVAHLRGGPPPLSPVGDGAAIVAAIATCRRLAGW